MDIVGNAIKSKSNMGDASVSEIVIPKEVTQIGEWAFSKCKNLTKVVFKGEYTPHLLAKGVFEGSDNLKSIEFANLGCDEAYLLAAAVCKLKVSHLLRSDDVGEKSWFDKWDLALKIVLESNDEKFDAANALCGEEDISYDNIGSIDGEMPGVGVDYLNEAAYNKSLLCYLRLTYDKFLDDSGREIIYSYIKKHAFGTKDAYSWLTLKEKCRDDLSYYRIYLEVVKPLNDEMRRMIEDLPQNAVAAKSFLIGESAKEAENLSSNLFI